MVSMGHSSVLIDALFDLNVEDGKPPRAHDHLDAEGIAWLEGAKKPFGKVDAVLVTHMHDDHFTAGCAANYMKSNGWAVLAGTGEVVEALSEYQWLKGEIGDRLVAAGAGPGEVDTFVIDGLTIYALGVRHTGCMTGPDKPEGSMSDGSPCMEHVAWLVEAGGRRILHLGDAKMAPEEFEQYPWLPGLQIDVAFVPFWFIDREGGVDVINSLIAPKTVVLMHWNRWNRDSIIEDFELVKDDLPPTVIFSEAFEKRVF
jgi:L-ascorbate metabolism protein UlaG (beta-lactamase superfamily)